MKRNVLISVKELEDHTVFKSNVDTIEQCSFDSDNDISLVYSSLKVVNFDKVAATFCSRCGVCSLSSTDSFVIFNDTPCFIEFKNQKPNTKNIISKFYESLMIFCNYKDCHYDYFVKNAIFFLVFNPAKDSSDDKLYKSKKTNNSNASTNNFSKNKICSHVFQKAKTHKILFGLGELKGRICKDIYTITNREFNNLLKEAKLENHKVFSYQVHLNTLDFDESTES